MNKLFVLLILFTLVFACSRKTVVLTNERTPVAEKTPSSPASAPGQVVYLNRCGRCHGQKRVERYSAAEWEQILPPMIRKAKLNAVDSIAVRTYVFSRLKD